MPKLFSVKFGLLELEGMLVRCEELEVSGEKADFPKSQNLFVQNKDQQHCGKRTLTVKSGDRVPSLPLPLTV